MEQTPLLEVLGHIDPSALSYQEWINVGMALKDEGYTAADWEAWSAGDRQRYHTGECAKKWKGFTGASQPVTGGTIVQYARNQGYHFPEKMQDGNIELAWDAVIGSTTSGSDVVVDINWLEGKDVPPPPRSWTKREQIRQLRTYLSTLFEPDERVGYVVKSYEKDGRYVPCNKGAYDRTAGQLIEALNACGEDMGAAIGDYDEKAGAWIRFNPMDGVDVRNENVTAFRYALVESDSAELEKQFAILNSMELPIALLVHSGRKSLHAIVRVDAENYNEYKKRVDELYTICGKNGLKIDTQNRNPSRLSRMPGIMRNGMPQYIVARNMGKASYAEWREWIDSVSDTLPDPESMADVWDNLPELSPTLIAGILRQGHKMLLAGPSKAGKSYSLIELCIAIAEGKSWFGWPCTLGSVMYVNLELDRASCLHRFKDVYAALGYAPEHLRNIDIWNLRGKSLPMDKLAPKLIRRASKKGYIAIVIDPIYKIITGDENSADQMAQFCNQFDMVCTQLGCAVIYCHHHSKGGQSAKRSMDRASGSGVFARDPDALLDMIELDVSDALRKAQADKAECAAWEDAFDRTQ
ncbi:MAG: AAA family ATPase, partial [Clostridia bacterium]